MDETLVRIGLWIHIAAAAGVIGGIAMELVAGHLLVRARDTSEVRALATFATYGGRLAALALVGLLLSGPDIASRMGFFEGAGVQGWIAVAIVAIVVIGGLGGGIHRKAFKGARELAGDTASPIGGDLKAHLARPLPWISMHVALGITLGTIWIMSNKPLGVVDAMTPVIIGAMLAGAAGVGAAKLTADRLSA